VNTESEPTKSKSDQPDSPPIADTKVPIRPENQNSDWWKSGAIWISIASLVCSVWSCNNNSRSVDAANRSANAAAISAAAAITNAAWITYQRNPHHDVTARILKSNFVLRGYSSEDTNGLVYIDLALINNGNQSEIIRRVTFYYDDGSSGTAYEPHILNLQLAKGDKQISHFVLNRKQVFVGTAVRVDIGITAVGPDAKDIESRWMVGQFTLAADGNGGSVSPIESSIVKIISDERLPNQHEQPLLFE